jgi:hypothetical protein
MSLTEHHLWPLLAPFIRVQTYDRDGGHKDPRHRIEAALPDDPSIVAALLTMEMPCVACAAPILPIRTRKGTRDRRAFVAVTCPLDVRIGCSRGRAAADEYRRIVKAVAG